MKAWVFFLLSLFLFVNSASAVCYEYQGRCEYSNPGGYGCYTEYGRCEQETERRCETDSGGTEQCEDVPTGRQTCYPTVCLCCEDDDPLPGPTNPTPGRGNAEYNQCLRDNRHVQPVSKRIEMCSHQRKLLPF